MSLTKHQSNFSI